MVEAFERFIAEKTLCSRYDKIILAVSGGVDSVVLTDLFYHAGFDFAVVHCNFRLRGTESDDDENFVQELADNYKVKYFTKSFETEKYAINNKCSIQEAARDLRYNWFNKLCVEEGFKYVAVAHHLDDQMETFFINLFRASGVKGLKGMPVKRGRIIRPLLFARREMIENYLKDNKLQFREDTSNKSDKYLRNQIRQQLLPLMAKLNPSNLDTLLSSMSFLQEENEVLSDLLDQKRKELFIKDDKGIKIVISQIKILSLPLLYKLLSDFGFNREVSKSIFKCLHNRHSGKIFYSTDYRLLIDREFVFIAGLIENISDPEYLVYEEVSKIDEPLPLTFVKLKKNKSFEIKKSKTTAYFDADLLRFPLKLRKWKQGDRFVPFGMKQKKLISDFLIDEKISQFDKENLWLLLSGDEIIWVIGYRASGIQKINNSTKSVLMVNLF